MRASAHAALARSAMQRGAHAVTISLSVIWLFSVMMPKVVAGAGGAPGGGGDGGDAMGPNLDSDCLIMCPQPLI